MRIRLSAEGGFAYLPGLQRPITVDLVDLPASEADALRALLDKADFFALPEEVGTPAAGAADMREFTIEVDNGDKQHTVKVSETQASPALIALIDRLQAQK
jgi:hypothetical protein